MLQFVLLDVSLTFQFNIMKMFHYHSKSRELHLLLLKINLCFIMLDFLLNDDAFPEHIG